MCITQISGRLLKELLLGIKLYKHCENFFICIYKSKLDHTPCMQMQQDNPKNLHLLPPFPRQLLSLHTYKPYPSFPFPYSTITPQKNIQNKKRRKYNILIDLPFHLQNNEGDQNRHRHSHNHGLNRNSHRQKLRLPPDCRTGSSGFKTGSTGQPVSPAEGTKPESGGSLSQG